MTEPKCLETCFKVISASFDIYQPMTGQHGCCPFNKNKEGSETERGGVIAVNFQDFIEFYHLFLSIDFSFTQIFDFHTVSYFLPSSISLETDTSA